jgi:two-component system nitrate/nitrite response regulator NarL
MVNILIVDDHILMRRVVREVIEQEKDFSVVAEACNGFEAEELASQTQPDVILMDLDMPGCDGFEATERVLARSPQSRVVIFTASHEERHMFLAILRGAIGYITKDVDPVALVHAIRCAARNDLCIPGPLAAQLLTHIRTSWRPHNYLSSRHAAAYAYRTPRRSSRRSANKALAHEATGNDLHRTQRSLSPDTRAESPGEIDPTGYSNPEEAATGISLGTDREAAGAPQELISLPIPIIRPLTDREQEILDLMRKGLKNREIASELEIAESTVHKHVQNIFEKLHARNRAEAIYFTNPGQ